ncbi:MarR family winged helix-turn-helix transcriptional regulator [Pseudonocardia nigra]|uniref:MarR family winged helix-turn-helix transcriptional regulator n=1 Tax=Pseudonocardia nigra TaxID=1921578 RepID=UPI001C5FDD76|nr:MarR family transcriptional regulator [Pseudonocardia nigra]
MADARETEPGAAQLLLEQQLCFGLYSASRAMTARYRPLLAAIGLTYSQYLVMLVLWESGAVGLKALRERLHLDSATLSPLLQRLEQRGLITRRRPSHDERTLEISCTAAGHLLYERAVTAQASVERATGLDPRELAALRDDLHRLAARLDAVESGEAEPAQAAATTVER